MGNVKSYAFYLCFVLLSTSYSAIAQQFAGLKLVAVNQVDHDVYAHTYLRNVKLSEKVSDAELTHHQDEEVSFYLKKIHALKEVSEASYDPATNTFTIISTKPALEEEIKRIIR